MKQNKGVAGVAILIGLVITAVMIPVAMQLVSKNADNRNQAANPDPCSYVCSQNGMEAACKSCRSQNQPTAKPTSKPSDKYCSYYTNSNCKCGCDPSTSGGSCKDCPKPTDKPKDKYCDTYHYMSCKCGCDATPNGGSCKSCPTDIPKKDSCNGYCVSNRSCSDLGMVSGSGNCAASGGSCCSRAAVTPTKKPNPTITPPTPKPTGDIVNGGFCNNANQCISGFCILNQCQNGSKKGERCWANSDCITGLACSSGQCVNNGDCIVQGHLMKNGEKKCFPDQILPNASAAYTCKNSTAEVFWVYYFSTNCTK